jgi:hypothetical protein
MLPRTSSTLAAVFAEVSKKMRLFSRAKASPSSLDTCRRCSRSLLFPMSMMTIDWFAFCRASSSHLVRWLNVSRLHSARENRERWVWEPTHLVMS